MSTAPSTTKVINSLRLDPLPTPYTSRTKPQKSSTIQIKSNMPTITTDRKFTKKTTTHNTFSQISPQLPFPLRKSMSMSGQLCFLRKKTRKGSRRLR